MSVLAQLLNGMQTQMTRTAAENSASALVAGLWQSTVLVAGVWLALKAVPQATATVRFAIWTLVFGLSALLPFAGILTSTHTTAAATQVRIDSEWSYLIGALWIVASTARLTQLAVQGWKLRCLWRRAVPVPNDLLTHTDCSDLLTRRRAQLCTSDDIDRPSVIGFFAPKILVPAWLLEQLSATELRHIVLHEMEHLRRRDDWMNLLQKIGLVVFPLNLALLWVDRRLAAEREIACDDGVLQQTQMRRAYATCLTSIAELRLERKMHRRVVALALGVFGTARLLRGPSEFSRRIESILRRRPTMNPMVAQMVAAVLVLGVFGAGVELMRAPQLVSFGSDASVAKVDRANGRFAGLQIRQADYRVGEARSIGDLGAKGTGTAREATFVVPSKVVAPRARPRTRSSANTMSETLPPAVATSGQALPRTISANASAGRPQTSRTEDQWMVLTSFDETAPARVVVRTSDGRFYVAPYAAVPVRDGWLIVQL